MFKEEVTYTSLCSLVVGTPKAQEVLWLIRWDTKISTRELFGKYMESLKGKQEER